MSETEIDSRQMQSMGNNVDRALDDKGKKPSQFEVNPDVSHQHDAEALVDKPVFVPGKPPLDDAEKSP